MHTQRRGPWRTAAGLLVTASLGCQTIVYADRSLIPDGGGQGGQESDAGPGCGTAGSGQAGAGGQDDGSNAGGK